MPLPTNIFPALGAFARAHHQLRRLAHDDANLAESGTHARTLENLAARFTALLNGSPTERAALASVERLRALAASADSTRDQLAAVCAAWLAGPVAAALAESGIAGAAPSSASPSDVLAALSRAMTATGDSVAANTLSLTTPSPGASNSGDGACYATLLTPGAADTALDSQLTRTQTIALTVVADAPHDGVSPGHESWRVRGTPTDPLSAGISAIIETIPVTTGPDEDPRNLVIDGCFTLPGTGGAPFTKHAASGAAVFTRATSGGRFVASALRVSGTGAGTLTQTITARSTRPAGGEVCAVALSAKLTSISGGTVTIRVSLNGTPLAETVVLNSSTATAAWLHRCAFLMLPRLGPADTLTVQIVTDSAFVGDLLIDGLSLAAADPVGGGLSMALFQGPRPFSRLPNPDRFTLATSSDDTGAFACFLRDVFAAQLPVSDTPTIDEALAI
jgi:hypothetical protein